MRRIFQVVLAVATGFLALTAIGKLAAKGSTSTTGTTLEFRDATSPSDKIRSDGYGGYGEALYQNGIDCVISEVFGSGQYFLRTVTGGCSTTVPRSVVLDFSNPVTPIPPADCSVTVSDGALNICGANSIADTRLSAGTMFTVKALTNGTSVSLPFSLKANFQGPGDFQLNFEQPVAVTGTSGLRTATAGPAAVAELYEFVSVHGKVSKVSLGRYYMPFSITAGE